MDPLSMTASIVAILELTGTVMKYANSVRNATKERAQIAIEASNMYGLLTGLQCRLETAQGDNAWLNQIKLLGHEGGILSQFRTALEDMVKLIPDSSKASRLQSKLQWKFTKPQLDNALGLMERLKTLILCAMNGDLMTLTDAIHKDLKSTKKDIKQVDDRIDTLQLHADEELQHRIAGWLQVPDPSTNFHSALKRQHPGTGKWLTGGDHFADWRMAGSSLMWLHGKAGCGKTILAATVLKELLDGRAPGVAIAYFYFDFSNPEKQASDKAVRSLLHQIALHTQEGVRALVGLYKQCGNGQRQPSDEEIRRLLGDVLARPVSTLVLLDALDECSDREQFLGFLCALFDPKQDGLRVLATSRRERDIEERLAPIASYNINIQSEVVDEDISAYVQHRLAADPKLKKWQDNIRSEIMDVMMKKANGMRVQLCKTNVTVTNLEQIVEILAIENGDEGGFFPEERLPDPADALVVCSSLVRYEEAANQTNHDLGSEDESMQPEHVKDDTTSKITGQRDKIIQLAHFSVKEYLLSSRCTFRTDFQLPVASKVIAEGCLQYLLYLAELPALTKEGLTFYPLAWYAGSRWYRHTRHIPEGDRRVVDSLAFRLLARDDLWVLQWAGYWRLVEPALCYAARSGLLNVVRELLKAGADIDGYGDNGTALAIASTIGDEKVVQTLLDAGANIDVRGSNDVPNPVDLATRAGHLKIVQTLVNTIKDVQERRRRYRRVLEVASVCGIKAIVEWYITTAVDANMQGSQYNKALERACINGHVSVMQLLVDAGADVNACDDDKRTMLQNAIRCHRSEAVAMLLAVGADINQQSGRLCTALQTAAYHSTGEMAGLLLESGADVNIQGGYYGSALQAAMRCPQSKETIAMLLDAGADVNIQGGRYGSALQAAIYHSQSKKIIAMLLDAGADVNIQGGRYGSALQAAICHSQSEETIAMLLDAGADVNTQGGRYGSALHAAAHCIQPEYVDMLLKAGADVNASCDGDGSALHGVIVSWYSKWRPGRIDIINALLNAGAEVEKQSDNFGTPLQAAVFECNSEVVQLLLSHGAEPRLQCWSNRTLADRKGPLHRLDPNLISNGALKFKVLSARHAEILIERHRMDLVWNKLNERWESSNLNS